MMRKRNNYFQYLEEIIGKPICAMERAANMLWIGIGEKIATTNPQGNNLFDEKCQSWLEREMLVYIR